MKSTTIIASWLSSRFLFVSKTAANESRASLITTAHQTPSDLLLPDGEPPRWREGAGLCNTSTTRACVERLEFCGTDNRCHFYSCDAWYRWGPPEYTGHVFGIPVSRQVPITFTGNNTMYLVTEEQGQGTVVEDDDNFYLPELTCEDNVPANALLGRQENTYTPGIIYGCQRWICVGDACNTYGEEKDPKEGIAVDFLRRCTATNVGNRYKFFCRDNRMQSNTDENDGNTLEQVPVEDYRMRSFFQAVDRGYVNCSDDNMDGPAYLYSTYFQSSLIYGNVNFGSTTDEYNETHASAVMQTNLEYMDAATDNSGSRATYNALCLWKLLAAVLPFLAF